MIDWKKFKDLGPWPFTPQPNKWGYLNNPRWQNPARAFVRGGPDDYDGRESEEPQIFPVHSNFEQSRDDQIVHNLCGHWHKVIPGVSPPEPPPPTAPLHPWWSCPMLMLPTSTGILYLSDDSLGYFGPDEYGYWQLYRYIDSSQTWTLVREEIFPLAYTRFEEYVSSATSKGDRHIFMVEDTLVGTLRLKFIIMDGNEITRISHIDLDNNTYGVLIPGKRQSEVLVIDAEDNIHIVYTTFHSTYMYRIYHFKSTDDGVTFVATKIDDTEGTFFPEWLRQDSAGNLYHLNASDTRIWKSSNYGGSWSDIGHMPMGSGIGSSNNFQILNDSFFSINSYYDGVKYSVRLYRSTDITGGWTLVFTPYSDDEWRRVRCVQLAYDGTYYYLVFVLTYATTASEQYFDVFRSSNGIDWSFLSTCTDPAGIFTPSSVQDLRFLGYTQLIPLSGSLYLSYYYSQSSLESNPGVLMLTVWKSSDSGSTWVPIQTPYYDAQYGETP